MFDGATALAGVSSFELEPAILAVVYVGWIVSMFVCALCRAEKPLTALNVAWIILSCYLATRMLTHSM